MTATTPRESLSLPSEHGALDYKWMARALALARKGEALTHPNPMVGAIVVAGDRAVGQGFHTYDGVKHAEILALEEAGGRARGATLYLNLEPCCHQGRTGPCTDAVIAAGISRVVAAMADPNPKVAGRGFEILRRAGIEVLTGVLETEARRLNEAFACWIRTGRPLVTLKVGLTLDGRVAVDGPKAGRGDAGLKAGATRAARYARYARTDAGLKAGATRSARYARYAKTDAGLKAGATRAANHERWITTEHSREEVQRMRHASDAVVTGIGTVLADDPLLTDRTGLARRRPLVRVVLDSRLRLPLRSKLVRTADGDVLVVTRASENSARAYDLEYAGVEVMRVNGTGARRKSRGGAGIPLEQVMDALGELEMLAVMIEAGPRLMRSALEAGIVDKAVLFYAPRFLGGAALPMLPTVNGHGRASGRRQKSGNMPELSDVTLRRFGPDFAVEGYLRDVYRNR